MNFYELLYSELINILMGLDNVLDNMLSTMSLQFYGNEYSVLEIMAMLFMIVLIFIFIALVWSFFKYIFSFVAGRFRL